MNATRRMSILLTALALLFTTVTVASAQLTTATLSGRVRDAQGGVIPGAAVVLTSETRGTTVPAVVTDTVGEFFLPNLAPDTYTLEVSLEGFQTVRRTGIAISGGDRSSLGGITLEVGGVAESVTVTAEAALVQSQSGERSFTVTTNTVESLPIANRSFTNLAALAPGVTAAIGGNVNAGIQPNRIGGGGAPNIQMDGVSTMDVASNRPALQMNIESIGEVKVVSSTYQAEFGRSSGVHVIAVTKSGTNQFRGSLYDVERNSDWNSNSQVNILNRDPKVTLREREWGFSLGGPIGKPGGGNKLFFFFAQEYAPREVGGDVRRFRVPTAAERIGDFSQSIDQNGAVYRLIRDAATGLPCTAADTRGCFQDGGVVGRISANRLYQTGVNILNLYPLPNVNVPGAAYNYEITRPIENHLAWQPAFRTDYNVTQSLRGSFKYSAWMQREKSVLGTLPGFNDSIMPKPKVDTWAATANYSINSTTFVEATYGRMRQPQTGCPLATQGTAPIICTSGTAVNDIAVPANAGLGALPRLFPESAVFDPRYYATRELQMLNTPVFRNGRVLIAPTFAWGNRVAAANAPPNTSFPGTGGLTSTYSDDFVASLTKLTGRHSIKTGFYRAHAVKYQAAAGGSGGTPGIARGAINFGNDNNNPLDSTFGFSNAALGIFSTYQQASAWAEGANSFRNIEAYVQDTWRMNDRLTLDYGMRFVHQQAQADDLEQGWAFLPEEWLLARAPRLYVAGCANGVAPCTGNNRQAMDPLTGVFLGPGSAVNIGAVVPGTGNRLNGLIAPGDGISTRGLDWPALRVGPRFGMAYDVSGRQSLVVRGGFGLFYGRGFEQNLVANPPATLDVTVRASTLQSIGPEGLSNLPFAGPSLVAKQYDSGYPTDVQWNTGVQVMLPFSTAIDLAYVGHHGWNEVINTNIGAVDIGAAFRPENQDPTVAPTAVAGASAIVPQLLSPFRGYNGVNMTQYQGWRTYHALQLSINRRLSRGLQFGFNDTISVSDKGRCEAGVSASNCTYKAPFRYDHNPDGTYFLREDQGRSDDLFLDQRPVTHIIKGNFVWDLPRLSGNGGTTRALGLVLNDWKLAGVWTAQTGQDYVVGFTYAAGGAPINLTGSPDYAARIRIVGDPGAGCSDDALRQFNTAAFAGPLASSDGLESGTGYLKGCFQSAVDMSLSRTVRIGGAKNVQVRFDVFNLFNEARVTGRNTTMNLASPSDPLNATNLPFDAAGNVIEARARPNGAGFGVANLYQAPRSVQLQLRFAF